MLQTCWPCKSQAPVYPAKCIWHKSQQVCIQQAVSAAPAMHKAGRGLLACTRAWDSITPEAEGGVLAVVVCQGTSQVSEGLQLDRAPICPAPSQSHICITSADLLCEEVHKPTAYLTLSPARTC